MAVKPHRAKEIDLPAAGDARINLDCRPGIRQDLEALGHDLLQGAHLVDLQIRGRTSAPVILHDLLPPPQSSCHLANLAMQVSQVECACIIA